MTESDYRTALIVGAGSGLSASLARTFGKVGMTVALAARRSPRRQSDNAGAETGAKSFVCDATDRAEVAKLFSDVEGALGAPDVVYNASYRARGQIIELNPDEVAKTLRSQRSAAFWSLRRRPNACCLTPLAQSFSLALPPA